ncbi:MAG: iron-sulfur cluster assembly accessory protein [Alphaproteobacteria bacterium]|jgi:iron-sulfur cluster assembly protein|nr:iron-sulfur cluster assembly accessory protein [Rhodospirillaceae bacterium]MDG2482280.1 iron-sulfur cluster assembly accessory protein [Alphaproteobacteria bacterium]MBT6206379.1 iron-sulfur cluster assembly accessory protein [Rhodospirillaceae bacterium]MBT6510161.1 iron-sulfur cluster assembly accessory protein [Rhodospirillaceae bacterium]MBT7612064.1 iron-sulfur cluster assembly accessory protein [Rhodospirillaceae bacterium]
MFGIPAKDLITLTDSAAERVKALMRLNDKAIGLKVGVKMAGCSGFSYTMDYAEEETGKEDIIEDKGVKLLIDPSAAMFLLGTELDWHEDQLESRFVFNNPNVKGMCGCGESFTV